MKCPHCVMPLQSAAYEQVHLDRCGKCKGVWLDEGEIATIVEIKEATFSPEVVREAIAQAFAGIPPAVVAGAKVVSCPKCANEMRLLNYGYDSGVIIDRCMSAHGVWLDAGELEKVQAFREQWDAEAPKHRASWVKLLENVQDKKWPAADSAKRAEQGTFMFRAFLGIFIR